MEQVPLPTAKVVRAYSLSAEVVAQVEELAAAENRSVSNMVETLLKRGLADRAKTREVVQALVDALERVRRAAEDIGTIVCNCGAPATGIQLAANTGIALAQSTLKIEPTKP